MCLISDEGVGRGCVMGGGLGCGVGEMVFLSGFSIFFPISIITTIIIL